MNKPQQIKHYIFHSWLVAGVIAFSASVILFFALGFFSYNKATEIAKLELAEKATKAARRISAELLLEGRGSPESVRLQMQKYFNIEQIEILPINQIAQLNSGNIQVQVPVPNLESKFSLVASIKGITYYNHFNFLLLVSCFSLIGLIVISGLWMQIKYLKRHVIKPIESLVAISTGEKVACDNWPTELQEISDKLNQSFREREQVVYSQVAQGVIHDIRTLLQSLQVATDLASEKQSEERFKNLLTISKSKLPNLLAIVNTALDGSREIKIKSTLSDLIKTLKNSIETNQAIAISKNIKIDFETRPDSLFAAHDPIQLERVFTNILKNAVEAVEDQQQAEKKIKITCESILPNKVKVTFEDNGHGLPPKAESVFRLLKSTKTHGSGLGLLVSRKIVEAHFGNIKASHSIDLKGARFEIELPREVQL
ncbi:MAG: HAMP domain-containing sensor histidine kinase [Pseudomonadota bacterium]|nr:HAMP domain-containing sensor histidine kinase [Pseudomonadota bacterium]